MGGGGPHCSSLECEYEPDTAKQRTVEEERDLVGKRNVTGCRLVCSEGKFEFAIQTVLLRAVDNDARVVCCRAPVLVALALMECGMKYEDAVELIRS